MCCLPPPPLTTAAAAACSPERCRVGLTSEAAQDAISRLERSGQLLSLAGTVVLRPGEVAQALQLVRAAGTGAIAGPIPRWLLLFSSGSPACLQLCPA